MMTNCFTNTLLFMAFTVIAIAGDDVHGQAAEDVSNVVKSRLLGVLEGSSGLIVSFSSDDKRILTAGRQEARVWNVDTLKPAADPFDHGEKVRTAVFSPDGNFVLTVGGREGKIWNVATGESLSLPHKESAFDGSFSPDGKLIVTTGDEARLWDCATGRLLRTLEHDGYVTIGKFSPKGDMILTVCSKRNGDAYLWDTATGRQLLGPLSEARVRSYEVDIANMGAVAFSPDGKKIATIDFRAVAVWNTKTGRELTIPARTKGQAGTTNSVSFSPDSTRLAVADEFGFINIYDANSGAMVGEITGRGAFYYASFTPNGKYIFANSWYAGLWDLKTGKRLLTFGTNGVTTPGTIY